MHTTYFDGNERAERRAELRAAVNNIFSEGLMIALSLALIPILVLPLFFSLPSWVLDSFALIDYAILSAFVLEYALKMVFSEDPKEFILNPWHVLDLLIIVVSLVSFIPDILSDVKGLPLLLRLTRIPVAISLSGRSWGREVHRQEKKAEAKEERLVIESVFSLDRPEEGWRPPCPPNGEKVVGNNQWRNVFNVSVKDLPNLGRESRMPPMVLEGKIKDRAFPQAEMFDGSAMIFLRVPDGRECRGQDCWPGKWGGLILIDGPDGMITLSNTEIPLVMEVPRMAGEKELKLTSSVIFYLLANEAMASVEELILAEEMELTQIESVPMVKQPKSFLTITYEAKKEIGQNISWLMHTRAICEDLLDGKVRTKAWNEDDERRVRSLVDRCDYLLETAQNVEDSLGDTIDFYLNTSSFQMNKVMRVIAVMTALTIIPTVIGGLMGMNLVGNPWSFSLYQVMTAVAILMLATAWVYYKLGWLRD